MTPITQQGFSLRSRAERAAGLSCRGKLRASRLCLWAGAPKPSHTARSGGRDSSGRRRAVPRAPLHGATDEADSAGEIDPSFVITHRMALEEAPQYYVMFRNKQDNCEKIVLSP